MALFGYTISRKSVFMAILRYVERILEIETENFTYYGLVGIERRPAMITITITMNTFTVVTTITSQIFNALILYYTIKMVKNKKEVA